MASEDAAVEDHDAEEEQAEHAQNVQDEVDDADMEQNSEVENPSSALSSTSASGSHANHESTNRLAMLLSQPDAEINQEIKRLKQVRERMKKGQAESHCGDPQQQEEAQPPEATRQTPQHQRSS